MVKNFKFRIVRYLLFQIERKTNGAPSISQQLKHILTDEKSINKYGIRRQIQGV